uniref:ATP synthase peripheral stalk subunit F6, mitochondrial n=1 Tax=Sinocyclocheilus grahami TaxID=75366 RepID=A0A672KFT9_SINGR
MLIDDFDSPIIYKLSLSVKIKLHLLCFIRKCHFDKPNVGFSFLLKSQLSGLDPIQKMFLDSIRSYSTKSGATGGLVDAGPEYQKALAEEITKLQRLYGGGDLSSFPEFKFPGV